LAPCGLVLFGGNATYQKALNEIGTTLEYTSRFVPVVDEKTISSSGMAANNDAACDTSMSTASCTTTTSTTINNPSFSIADREYNVASLAKAALGVNSMVSVNEATPNKFSCLLAPTGSPNLLRVDLLTLNRRQEYLSEHRFDCSEVVREIVSTLDAQGNRIASGGRQQALMKEIETTSLYTLSDDQNQIKCRQRSAAFLLPSQNDAVALKLWEASRGRPVDVRYYDVLYTRK
jgi:hypothetical protein